MAQANGPGTRVTEIDTIAVRNQDIAGALRWLTDWALPPITETNLMNLGSILVEGSRDSWNGSPVYSVERSEISALDFHWLIPSNYQQTDTGVTISLDSMLNLALAQAGQGEIPQIEEAREALLALGLDTLRINSAGNWNWNGETGALQTGFATTLIDQANTAMSLAMGGPSLAGWEALTKLDDNDDAIAEAISLNAMEFSLADSGLMDRILAYAGTQMGASAEDMRVSLPALLRMGSSQFAAMNPRIPGYVDALSAFVSEGGSLKVTMTPQTPVTLKQIQETGQQTPNLLPDLLNMDVTRD